MAATDFSKRLLALRKQDGLTQFEAGVACGLPVATAARRFGQWETGDRQPNATQIQAIIDGLGARPASLFAW